MIYNVELKITQSEDSGGSSVASFLYNKLHNNALIGIVIQYQEYQ